MGGVTLLKELELTVTFNHLSIFSKLFLPIAQIIEVSLIIKELLISYLFGTMDGIQTRISHQLTFL